jgi:hypothetical protein
MPLGPDGARKVLDDIQAAPIDMADVNEKWITVPAQVDAVSVRIVKPISGDVMVQVPRRAGRTLMVRMRGGIWILEN